MPSCREVDDDEVVGDMVAARTWFGPADVLDIVLLCDRGFVVRRIAMPELPSKGDDPSSTTRPLSKTDAGKMSPQEDV